MSDESRREFLRKAGVAAGAAAVVGLTGSTAAHAADTDLLPKEKFAAFFDDVFALVSDPRQKNVSVAEVFRRHGLEPHWDLEPHARLVLGPLLQRKPGMGPGGVANDGCGACGACGLCALCGEADTLSVLAAAVAVTALGGSLRG